MSRTELASVCNLRDRCWAFEGSGERSFYKTNPLGLMAKDSLAPGGGRPCYVIAPDVPALVAALAVLVDEIMRPTRSDRQAHGRPSRITIACKSSSRPFLSVGRNSNATSWLRLRGSCNITSARQKMMTPHRFA